MPKKLTRIPAIFAIILVIIAAFAGTAAADDHESDHHDHDRQSAEVPDQTKKESDSKAKSDTDQTDVAKAPAPESKKEDDSKDKSKTVQVDKVEVPAPTQPATVPPQDDHPSKPGDDTSYAPNVLQVSINPVCVNYAITAWKLNGKVLVQADDKPGWHWEPALGTTYPVSQTEVSGVYTRADQSPDDTTPWVAHQEGGCGTPPPVVTPPELLPPTTATKPPAAPTITTTTTVLKPVACNDQTVKSGSSLACTGGGSHLPQELGLGFGAPALGGLLVWGSRLRKSVMA